MRKSLLLFGIALVLAACGGGDDDAGPGDDGTPATTAAATGLAADSILQAEIAGTTNSRISEDAEEVVRQLDVTGDWEAVATDLVVVARESGFQIIRINCSETGHDITAVKTVTDGVHLMEGRSSPQGVEIALSLKEAGTTSFRSSGQCPGELINAAL